MKSQIFLLKLNTVFHAYFTSSSIIFVLLFTMGKHSTFVDIGAILTFLSFVFFRRCVMIDIYNHIKQDLDEFELPILARDSLTRDFLKNMFGKTSVIGEDNERMVHKTRLDILKNVEPFVIEDDTNIITDMYNRKIQYIVGNIIIGLTFLNKYDMKWANILVMLWVLVIFPL